MNSDQFTMWFRRQSQSLAGLDVAEIVNRLHSELSRLDPNLGVEVSEPDSEGVRELIVTANGHTDLFHLVREIGSRCADIQGWRVIALKPARGFDYTLTQGGSSLSPEKWEFAALKDEYGNLGLRLFVPGKKIVIVHAVLQTIVETGVGEEPFSIVEHIEYTQDKSTCDSTQWLPIEVLPEYLRWWHARGSGC